MNADEVRNVKFGKGIYDRNDVSDLLGRIAAEIDAGRRAAPLIANAAFHQRHIRGYDARAVDWFLNELRRQENPDEVARRNADPWRDLAADPYYIHRDPGALEAQVAPPPPSKCGEEWREFSQQPGIRLMWVRAGATQHELRTAEQHPLVAVRHGLATTLTAGGRTFKSRPRRSHVPSLSETIYRDRPGSPAHLIRLPSETWRPLLRHTLDETGLPILFSGGSHINRLAGGYIIFPDQRWLRFPVRGARRANAIMTAVDQAGNKVARYRLARDEVSSRNGIQIMVHPSQDLTEELTIALALTAPWLRSYFRSEGGGG